MRLILGLVVTTAGLLVLATASSAVVARGDVTASGVGVPSTNVLVALGEPGEHTISLVGTAAVAGEARSALGGGCLDLLELRITLSDNQPGWEQFPLAGATFASGAVELVTYDTRQGQWVTLLEGSTEAVTVRVSTEWGGGEIYGYFDVQSRSDIGADCVPAEPHVPAGQRIRFSGYFSEYNTEAGPRMDWSGRLSNAVAVPNEGDSWGALKAQMKR